MSVSQNSLIKDRNLIESAQVSYVRRHTRNLHTLIQSNRFKLKLWHNGPVRCRLISSWISGSCHFLQSNLIVEQPCRTDIHCRCLFVCSSKSFLIQCYRHGIWSSRNCPPSPSSLWSTDSSKQKERKKKRKKERVSYYTWSLTASQLDLTSHSGSITTTRCLCETVVFWKTTIKEI